MSDKHELYDVHVVMKNTIDPWTIYDRLEHIADYTLSDMKYGTPNQFKDLSILTLDVNDGNHTLILAFRINTWGSYYIDIIFNELAKIRAEGVIGQYELHAKSYKFVNQIFRGGINNIGTSLVNAEWVPN